MYRNQSLRVRRAVKRARFIIAPMGDSGRTALSKLARSIAHRSAHLIPRAQLSLAMRPLSPIGIS